MKHFLTHFSTAAAVTLVVAAGSAMAQDQTSGHSRSLHADGNLDVTMTVIGRNAKLPDAVTKQLELPKDDSGAYIAAQQGVDHSAKGLGTANAARADGRAFGEATAAAARQHAEVRAEASDTAQLAREEGRAFGEATAAAAQQNREDLEHGAASDLGTLVRGQPPIDKLPTLPEVPGAAGIHAHAQIPAIPGRP
ncbi:MAG TPA: hypothetical protein VFY39_09530 [Gammaproteobacteria bacterium]|nr:hypothetical protein [Gammaproteobacteria bacterium]